MSDDIARQIQQGYDQLAAEYTRRIYDELRHKPLDRELLASFAERVRERGDVCDLGCGPGHVARYLRDAGLPVFGLDLSEGMLEQARRRNADIPFRQGNMMSLELADGALAGIAAFYAIVNIPQECLSLIFREVCRVLQPGGLLLLAFHIGNEVAIVEELWEEKVSMNFYFFPPQEIKALLEAAGLKVEQIIEREAYPEVEVQTRRAYVFAGKPT